MNEGAVDGRETAVREQRDASVRCVAPPVRAVNFEAGVIERNEHTKCVRAGAVG